MASRSQIAARIPRRPAGTRRPTAPSPLPPRGPIEVRADLRAAGRGRADRRRPAARARRVSPRNAEGRAQRAAASGARPPRSADPAGAGQRAYARLSKVDPPLPRPSSSASSPSNQYTNRPRSAAAVRYLSARRTRSRRQSTRRVGPLQRARDPAHRRADASHHLLRVGAHGYSRPAERGWPWSSSREHTAARCGRHRLARRPPAPRVAPPDAELTLPRRRRRRAQRG